jgi:hypothetical protein
MVEEDSATLQADFKINSVLRHISLLASVLFSLIKLIKDGLLAFTTIALALKAPTIRDPTSQSIVIWIWTAGILFIYSFLMYVFRIKNGGYPFKLFL